MPLYKNNVNCVTPLSLKPPDKCKWGGPKLVLTVLLITQQAMKFLWDVDNIISKIFGGRVWAYIVRKFEAQSLTTETCDQTGKNILRVLGNVVAKWHHQLRVGCMISHVRSTIMWRNISEQTTCTQESRGKAVSYRLATLLFGKWLKKPFLTQMLKRLIDLMRTGLFCKRNFHRQLVYMEEMELHVFFWPWSTTIWTEE